jgi:hypothetical protein
MSDNFFSNCPAKMSDGRHLTDYRTSTRREEFTKHVNKIVRNDDYRMFLQQNGANIMDEEWEYYKKTSSCNDNECVHTYPTRVYPPWFVEERIKYDSLSNPQRTTHYKCETTPDYRLNEKQVYRPLFK